MEEDIKNYLQTVRFRGTPCSLPISRLKVSFSKCRPTLDWLVLSFSELSEISVTFLKLSAGRAGFIPVDISSCTWCTDLLGAILYKLLMILYMIRTAVQLRNSIINPAVVINIALNSRRVIICMSNVLVCIL